MNTDEKAARVQKIGAQVAPFLAGEGPEVQAGVLADLLAMFLAGHANFLREEILQRHLRAVRDLIEPNERLLFNGRQHPQNRRTDHDPLR